MLEKIIHRSLMALVFLLPLFFLPLTNDFFDFNKNLLLITGVLLLTLLWLLKMVLDKKVSFRKTGLDLPVLLVCAAYLLSFLFASTNKIEALFLPQNTGTILALTFLYFVMTNNLKPASLISLFQSLIASATLLSLIALYQVLGVPQTFIGEKSSFAYLRLPTFSPAGGLFSLALFLSVNLLLLLFLLYSKRSFAYQKWQEEKADEATLTQDTETETKSTSKNNLVFFLYIFAGLWLLSGFGVTLFQLLTSAKPVFLPQFSGWVIALEAFKNFPFFGVGVENFVSAFTAGKPLSFNATTLWNSRFGVSANFYFQVLTTVGLVGFLSWLILFWQVIKNRHLQKISGYALFLIILFFALFPPSFLLLFGAYLLLSFLAVNHEGKILQRQSSRLANFLFVIFLLFSLVSFYGLGRVLTGEVLFRKSLVAASQNKGGETYSLQIQAINSNPSFDSYHASFSQINLALANSLASKKEVKDADKQNINQLITQAINEGKNAIALSPTRVSNWENLANIYQALIQSAQGANQWTLASYQQALTLDPLNPVLRVNLGGLFFGQKNYDLAMQQFQAAISLKADYANAHYNLAEALKAKELWAEAIKELEQTRMLVAFDSNDYKNLNKELDELRAKLPPTPTGTTGTPETLTSPASEAAQLKQPVKLPKEAAPVIPSPSPTLGVNPTSTPSGSPSASPSATPNL